MKHEDKANAIWYLIMQASTDIESTTPRISTMNGGVITVDAMLSRMAEAAKGDYEYGFALHTCLMAGLCYKVMLDLMGEADIELMMTQSQNFHDEIKRN